MFFSRFVRFGERLLRKRHDFSELKTKNAGTSLSAAEIRALQRFNGFVF